jgi:hypothetical protein
MKTLSRAQLKQFTQRRSVRWVIGIGLGYLALCILVVVPLLNWGLGAIYQQQTGRSLESGFTTFNPFTFAITANDIADHNADGSLLWSVKQVHVNVSPLQSLFQLAPVLDEVNVDGLQLHPHLLADGRWNFADIIQHQSTLAADTPAPKQQPNNSGELPALIINNIRVTIAALQFTDSSQKPAFSTRLDNILFELQDFSTLADAGQGYSLSATAPDAGELLWKGTLSVKAGQSQGELAIKNINLLPVWQYLKSSLNFTLQSALLNANGHYDAQWKDAFTWSVTKTQVALGKGKLRSGKADARNAEITLGGLTLNGLSASSKTQLVDIAEIKASGLQLASWSNGSESGLLRAFTVNSDDADTNPGKPWNLLIRSFTLDKAAIDWRLAELNDRVLNLDQLNVTATDIDTSGKRTMAIKLDSRIDKDTQITATGGFNLTSLDGDFSSRLQNLPLVIAQPFLSPHVRADIADGRLNSDAELQVRNAELTQVKTSGSMTDVKLRSDTQELVKWTSMKWSDTQIDLAAQKIDVPLLEVSGFDSRLVLHKDGTTNLGSLFPPAVATPDAAKLTPQTEADKPWDFTLHKLALEKSSFRFNDQSLTPNFTAAVQNFTGTLTELSSDSSKPANFKFHGDVDGYAPVNLQGHTQPFLKQPQLDARLDFENLDLGGLSGYSSTYAGWRIERGLLTANLHYRLNDGRILGDNHIEMDQLKLGERVASATAADVPLRLALALITDENGLATLDIGVSGNTNEPSFDLGKVIRQAVRNTFVKIVKSPFTLLAKLVGSKEDLGLLPFNSGSSQLLTTATRKLNSLQQALQKRPELRIELRGHYDQNTDTRGLRAAQIKQQLLERGLSSADIKAKNERWQKAVVAEYRALKLAGDKDLSPEQMHEQWLQTIPVTTEALVQLAAQRSINAKQFLVQQLKVENNRVLINSNLDCTVAEMCSRRIVRLDLSDLNQSLPQP